MAPDHQILSPFSVQPPPPDDVVWLSCGHWLPARCAEPAFVGKAPPRYLRCGPCYDLMTWKAAG